MLPKLGFLRTGGTPMLPKPHRPEAFQIGLRENFQRPSKKTSGWSVIGMLTVEDADERAPRGKRLGPRNDR
jgi:hypothetical protein